MFRAAHNLAPNLSPINTRIHILIHQPANHHVVTPDHVQPMRRLCARLRVIHRTYDALHRLLQHQVRHLVAGDERPDQGAAVDCED